MAIGDYPGIGDDGDGGGGGGGSPGPGYTGTPIHNVTFKKDLADSTLRVLVYANVWSDDDIQFIAYLTIDGIVRNISTENIPLDSLNSKGKMSLTLPAYVSGLAAGDHNIVFSMISAEVDHIPMYVQPGCTLEITELKQAAL